MEYDGADASDSMGLAVQDLKKLDIEKLTPLTPEVISRQATINIGERSMLLPGVDFNEAKRTNSTALMHT